MLRVFLAEDESLIRETLRDTVPWEKCGYTFVGESGDGEMALPLIRESRPVLERFLSEKVFAGAKSVTLAPDKNDVEGFDLYLQRFVRGLAVEQAAVEQL